MPVVDGVVYADDFAPVIEAISVQPLEGHRIEVRFEDGQVRVFDMSGLLNMGDFRRIADPEAFATVHIDGGAPAWLDGSVDIAPETVYYDGKPV
ncbi:MAG: DUF2442 domain-containing protein [Propionibacteriaceae bacterium]|jgi:hypothetical protein|nr:DUF2442 domain-containing protein [Propionibacteriaceae bacterium]